jgi:hypothetical protein
VLPERDVVCVWRERCRASSRSIKTGLTTDVMALWASKAQSRGTLGVFGVLCECE